MEALTLASIITLLFQIEIKPFSEKMITSYATLVDCVMIVMFAGTAGYFTVKSALEALTALWTIMDLMELVDYDNIICLYIECFCLSWTITLNDHHSTLVIELQMSYSQILGFKLKNDVR